MYCTTKRVAEDDGYTKHRALSLPWNLEINNFQSRSDEALTPNFKIHCPFLSSLWHQRASSDPGIATLMLAPYSCVKKQKDQVPSIEDTCVREALVYLNPATGQGSV